MPICETNKQKKPTTTKNQIPKQKRTIDVPLVARNNIVDQKTKTN